MSSVAIVKQTRALCSLSDGSIFALQNGVTYFLRGFIRFVPDQDTATEVLVVLGIVVAAYFFSGGENLQTIKQQFSISASEASSATGQK